jgi:hypothetical protein
MDCRVRTSTATAHALAPTRKSRQHLEPNTAMRLHWLRHVVSACFAWLRPDFYVSAPMSKCQLKQVRVCIVCALFSGPERHDPRAFVRQHLLGAKRYVPESRLHRCCAQPEMCVPVAIKQAYMLRHWGECSTDPTVDHSLISAFAPVR